MRAVDHGAAAGYRAVVVHFSNDAVYEVLRRLGLQNPAPTVTWVVDNSGDLDQERVEAALPGTVVLPAAGNRGYAAAVNSVRAAMPSNGLLLVLTHEVILAPGCVAALLGAMDDEPRAGSAGPALHLTSDTGRVFSLGGSLTRWAWPVHDEVATDHVGTRTVGWIDGSVLMLRLEALDEIGWFDEGYFLYYEEIDLALRLKRAGWSTLVTSGAIAYQEPGGYPPFLAVRNRFLLVRRNPEVLRVPFPAFVARVMMEILWVARRRGLGSIAPSLRGLMAGLRGRSGRPAF